MVGVLAGTGAVADEAVLCAMGRVPRERFVPRFWAVDDELGMGGPDHPFEWQPGEGPWGDRANELVYDADRALGIAALGASPWAGWASSVSAPNVVGHMLELLRLAPGQRVLEVGTGSGYNAALLSELVGPAGAVTSIELEPDLAAAAAEHLEAVGCRNVEVVVGDGYAGAPGHGPFDRVVVTAGCPDVSPQWLRQMAPDGLCLVPLQHGGWHPVTALRPSGRGALGRAESPARFLPLRGSGERQLPWAHPGPVGHHGPLSASPLPRAVAVALLRPTPAGHDWARWDLGFLLALEDSRAVSVLALAEDRSLAEVAASGREVIASGEQAAALRDRLVEVAELWLSLGCPRMQDYAMSFAPTSPPGRPTARAGTTRDAPSDMPGAQGSPRGTWTVHRTDYDQALWLEEAA